MKENFFRLHWQQMLKVLRNKGNKKCVKKTINVYCWTEKKTSINAETPCF